MISSFIGSFPRPKRLIKAIGRFRSKKINREVLKEEYKIAIKKLIEKLEKIGIESGTDGMFKWDDIFSPFVEKIGGLNANGLYRFFDNNTYYRVPVIENRLKYSGPITLAFYKDAVKLVRKYKIRPALPGPLTFALLSDNRFYTSVKDILVDFTNILVEEIRNLRLAGAEEIEIHEPSLVSKFATDSLIREDIGCLKKLSEDVNTKIWILSYFKYYKTSGLVKILEKEIGLVELDIINNPEAIKYVDASKNKSIILGLVDARNTLLEDPQKISKIIKGKNKYVYGIAPNTSLEFLPESRAYNKLKILRRTLKYIGDKYV